MEKKILSCDEHIDWALDDFVDKYSETPLLNKVENTQNVSTSCEYCQNDAIYIVSNIDSTTKCG
jgi:CxxH/CxxC protein (TIGR04129 family)